MSEERPENHDEYILVNITEQVVKKKVRAAMAEFDMCQCDKCYLDACAIILNKLPPHYVTTQKGKLLTLVDVSTLQSQTNLTVHVLQALILVKNSPKH